MTTEPIRLARPDVGEEELAAVAEVLESGQLTMGPWVARFEQALARAVGTADAVARPAHEGRAGGVAVGRRGLGGRNG